MVSNKKGISNIVSVLLIVLLVIVAVGVVWVAVRGTLEDAEDELGIGQKCLKVDVYATSASCSSGVCNVTVKRGTGGDDIDGVRVIFTNENSQSAIEDISRGIDELSTITNTSIATGLSGNIEEVEVAAYFEDDAGEKQVCDVMSGSFTTVSNA